MSFLAVFWIRINLIENRIQILNIAKVLFTQNSRPHFDQKSYIFII